MITDQQLRDVAEKIAWCAMGEPEEGGFYFYDVDDLGNITESDTRRAVALLRNLLELAEETPSKDYKPSGTKCPVCKFVSYLSIRPLLGVEVCNNCGVLYSVA